MIIFRLVLLHIFGRGNYWKLPALYGAASILGLLLASGLGQFEVFYTYPWWRVAATLFVVGQAAVLLVLFVASGTLRSYGTFEQILVHWPIKPRVRWMALILPAAILSSLTTVLISFPLGVIASSVGLPIGLGLIILALGGAVSFCGYWALRSRWLLAQQAMYLLYIALEYKSISLIASDGLPIKILILAGWVIGLTAIIGLFTTNMHTLAKDVVMQKPSRGVWITRITGLWFGKKIWRRRSLLVNFSTTAVLSMGLALLCRTHPEYTVFAGLASGLLGATIASDIRAVARKNSPAEIVGLKGTAYFLRNHVCVAAIVAIAATLPLSLLHPTGIETYLQLFVGISAGLFAGTLVVPAPRDIAAQCVATLICISLLLVPDHVASWRQSTPAVHSIWQLATALLLLMASAGIEYKRNNYRWRYHAS